MKYFSVSARTKSFCGVLALVWIMTPLALAGEVKTIQNAKQPRGKPVTLKLTEELRIGPEQDEERFVWPSIQTTVDVDDAGNMYVVDTKQNRVVKIDPEGKFAAQIGAQGQGPGEFQQLAGFQLLADGTAIAFEFLGPTTKFSMFDAEGAFVDTKSHTSLETLLRSVQYAPNGDMFASIFVTVDQANQKTVARSGILNNEFEVLEELTKFESPLPDQSQFGDPEYWVDLIARQLATTSQGLLGFAAFDAQSRAYTAVANTYEITLWDPSMKALLRFGREYDPVPLTDEELKILVEPVTEAIKSQLPAQLQTIISRNVIKRAVEKAEFPPVKNPVNGLHVMDNGLVLVVHDTNLVENKAKIDMFNDQGAYVGQFHIASFASNRMTFHDGHLYAIESDEDDENQLVRYQYEVVAR